MDKTRSPNDLNAPVPKFCLTLESFRRSSDGRVRSAPEFLQHFFPYDASKSTDRLFRFIPNDVRGPVLTSWGLRGAKSALKDSDEKVQGVVHDALVAGDIDHEAFEDAIVPEMLVRWVPLGDWWAFWRGGRLSKQAIQKGLEAAYDLVLFDAKWFFDTIESNKLRGTDVVSEGLTKAELTEWIRKVHAAGDGSPRGLLTALGWEKIVAKTPNDVLVKVLDALATKLDLLVTTPVGEAKASTTDDKHEMDERPSTRITPVPAVGPGGAESSLASSSLSGTGSRPAFGSQAAMRGRTVPPPLPPSSPSSEVTKVEQLFGDPEIAGGDESIAVVVDDESPTEVPTPPPPGPDQVREMGSKAPGFRSRSR